MVGREFLAAVLAPFALSCACAAPCTTDDFETQVTGVSQCLVMKRYGTSEPTAMVVWLHGDAPLGATVDYQYSLAEKTAANFSAGSVMSVALLRPGFGGSCNGRGTSRYETATGGSCRAGGLPLRTRQLAEAPRRE